MNFRIIFPGDNPKSTAAIADETMQGLDRDQCLEAAAEFESLAAIIRERITGSSKGETGATIPKGFVMVNMSAQEQKELRQLSRACGVPFRNCLRHALLDLKIRLKEWAELKKRTGLDAHQQSKLLTSNTSN
jgi:hypothetical protein